jgi:GntR family transcriptional regulator
VIKAYAELEKAGLLVMRQGAGAFVTLKRRTRQGTTRMQAARRRVGELIEQLRDDGLADEEIRRAFEAELLEASGIGRQR